MRFNVLEKSSSGFSRLVSTVETVLQRGCLTTARHVSAGCLESLTSDAPPPAVSVGSPIPCGSGYQSNQASALGAVAHASVRGGAHAGVGLGNREPSNVRFTLAVRALIQGPPQQHFTAPSATAGASLER